MYNSNDLWEARARQFAESKSWLEKAENDGLPEEEVKAEWETRLSALERLKEDAEKAERREKISAIETDLNRPQARMVSPVSPVQPEARGVIKRDRTLRNWLLSGTGFEDRSSRAMEANAAAGMALDKRSVSFHIGEELEKRVVLAGSAGAGKELVPTNLPSTFTQYLSYYAPILNYATIESSDDTRSYLYPIVDDTASTGFQVPENGLIPDQDFATANVTLNAWKFSSGIQKLSIEFLRGSVGNPEGRVSALLANRIARTFATACFGNGNGVGAPQGLGNVATTSSTLSTRGVLTADGLIDLVYSVPMPYDQNLTFVMNRSTVAKIRQLKTSQGAYIWEDNFQVGQPPTIMGIPVLISPDVAPLTATGANKVVFLGDLKQLVVRVAGGVSVTRSDERYMEYGLVAFSAIQFLDAKYVGPAGSLRALVNPAT